MRDERFRDLCVAYVTAGLSGDEVREFLEELDRRGADGREELRRVRETFASVSLEAESAEPPPELKDRVMAVPEEDSGAAEGGADIGPGDGDDGSGPRRGRWIAAAAAAALLAFLGIQNLQLRDSLESARVELDSATAELARLDTLEERLGQVQQDLLTVASPGTRTRLLSATREQFPGRARVFVDPQTGRALLFARDLPILSPDSVYQLWTIRDGEPESAGTFRPGEDQRARVEIAEAERVLGADAVAVTVEPAPGQPKPTTRPVLVAAAGSS